MAMKRFRQLVCVTLLATMLGGSTGCMYVGAAKMGYKVVKFAAKNIEADKAEKASAAAKASGKPLPETASTVKKERPSLKELIL